MFGQCSVVNLLNPHVIRYTIHTESFKVRNPDPDWPPHTGKHRKGMEGTSSDFPDLAM